MTKIIAIANQKGGVGKTDLCVNLASFLSSMGHKTLLIDLDPQSNATDYLIEDRPNLSSADLLLDDTLELPQTITTTEFENLDIIPAHSSLSGAGVRLASDVDMQFKLRNKLTGLENYEYVLIDTPPTLGFLTINAFVSSDEIIIPTQSQYFAMDAIQQLIVTIKKIRSSLNPKLNIRGICLTMYDRRTILSRQVKEQVHNEFPGMVFDTVIPVNVRLAESPSYHKPIMHYAPDSTGAAAYEKLAHEFLGLDQKIEVIQELTQ